MKVWGFFMLCWIHNCKCQHFFVYCGMNKKYQKYIDYIVSDIEAPYFKNIRDYYGLPPNEYEMVLSKVYNQPVTTKNNSVHDTNSVYDGQGNEIYYETSNGCWSKREYDDQGNRIYFENSYGEIEDNR